MTRVCPPPRRDCQQVFPVSAVTAFSGRPFSKTSSGRGPSTPRADLRVCSQTRPHLVLESTSMVRNPDLCGDERRLRTRPRGRPEGGHRTPKFAQFGSGERLWMISEGVVGRVGRVSHRERHVRQCDLVMGKRGRSVLAARRRSVALRRPTQATDVGTGPRPGPVRVGRSQRVGLGARTGKRVDALFVFACAAFNITRVVTLRATPA